MEFYQLKHFIAVAETASFTRAAERAHLTQPALSGSIARLESTLGVCLFVRSKKGVSMTDAGQRFYTESVRLVREFKRLRADITGASERQTLRVGIIRTFPTERLTGLLRAVQTELSGVDIEVAEGTPAELDSRLAQQKLDVALTILDATDQATQVPLIKERYLLYVPSGHRLAEARQVSLSDLNDERFIVRTSCETYAATTQMLLSNNVRTKVVCRTQQDDRALELVRAGVGVALMPELYEAQGVRKIPLRDYELYRTVGLRWLPQGANELVERFAAFARVHPWSSSAAMATVDGTA